MTNDALNPLVRLQLTTVEWDSLSVIGQSDPAAIPAAITDLLTATSDERAKEAFWRLDNHVLVQGQLFEAARYVVPVLLAGLAGPLPRPAHVAVVDLLVEICAGAPHESEIALGKHDLGRACRAAAAEGLWLIYGVLLDEDQRLREWALQIVNDIDPDRARAEAVLTHFGRNDPDPKVRAVAQSFLEWGPVQRQRWRCTLQRYRGTGEWRAQHHAVRAATAGGSVMRVVVGSHDVVSIEAEIEEPRDPQWLSGHFRLWVRRACIGDWDDVVTLTAVASWCDFRVLLVEPPDGGQRLLWRREGGTDEIHDVRLPGKALQQAGRSFLSAMQPALDPSSSGTG